MTYLEVVGLLSAKLKGKDKQQLDYVIERKTALKQEDQDLDGVLDDLLRGIRGGKDETQ